MCVLAGCEVPVQYTRVNSLNYGLSPNAICDSHFDLIRNEMNAKYSTLGPLVSDLVMLKVLMMDKPTVEAHLQTLDRNMLALDPASPNGPRLGNVLGRYENRCFFPAFLIVPLGYIANGFDNLGRSGFLSMKDYGAGIGHGKYTHRIQWHVVMRTITQNFHTHINNPWQYSPLELFLTCTSTVGAIGPVAGLGHHSTNLFGYIFDLAADGVGTYCWPDELFDEMRKTAKYPNIGRSANKNWLKRNTEHTTFALSQQAYNGALANHQAATKELFDARYKRDDKSGPARWVGNYNVGKAKEALNTVPPLPAKPVTAMEQKRQNLLATGNWVPMGPIPDADPFGRRLVPNPPINYGDAILVPQGVPPPSNMDIQTALASSRAGLNLAQLLPVIAASGHA
jgi:hypothetical protein